MMDSLLQRIELLYRQGDLPTCIDLCQRGLLAYDRGQNPYGWASLHSMLARCYLAECKGGETEELEAVIHHYGQALQIFTPARYPEDWATCHDFLGLAFWMRHRGDRSSNIEKSIDHYQNSLQVWTHHRDPEIWAGIHDGLADAFKERIRGSRPENLQQARHHYAQALEVWTRDQNPERWARVHLDLADLFRQSDQGKAGQAIEEAIYHYRQALTAVPQERFPSRWAHIHHNLGDCFGERIKGGQDHNLEQSISHYESALQVFQRESHAEEWASTISNLGVSYQHRISGSRPDNLLQAIHNYQLALQVYTPEAAPVDWARTQINLGNAQLGITGLHQAQRTEQAIALFNSALEIITREEQPELWAAVHYNLGNAYSQRRWWDMSRYLQGDVGVEQKREQRASNLEHAIRYYQSSLQVFKREDLPRDWAMVQNSLGQVYMDRIRGNSAEDVELAIIHLNRALLERDRVTRPELWAATQLNLGLAYEKRVTGAPGENKQQAVRYYKQALQVFEPERFPLQARKTLHNLAGLYFARGQWREALRTYDRVGETFVDPDSVLYTEQAREFDIETTAVHFPNAAYCLLKLGRPSEAFDRLEQGRARLLKDALQRRAGGDQLLPEGQLQAGILETIRQSFDLAHGVEPSSTLSKQGLQDHSASHHYLSHGDGAELEDFVIVQPDTEQAAAKATTEEQAPILREGSALIAPLVTSRGGAILVASGQPDALEMEDVIFVDRLTDQTLGSLLEDWLRTYIALRQAESRVEDWWAAIERVTGELWSLLFEPIRERLSQRDIRHLILIPQGRLQLLPLHAAWRWEGSERRYLLDDYKVSFAPSVRVQNLCHERLGEPIHSGSLVVGVDIYQDMPGLSHASAEAQVVADLLDTHPVLDQEASKELVLQEMGGKGFLHFACHGSYGWHGNPLGSSLFLAGDQALTLKELIAGQNLQGSRLVVLSACETGIANMTPGPDEYVGLPAGFLLLGVPGIVSSLWVVNDRSTFLLIERFYQNLLRQGLAPSQALREAQLWLRDVTRKELGDYFKSHIRIGASEAATAFMETSLAGDPEERPYANPFYWAAFLFTGA